MANGRINDFYKQYEQLISKFEKQEQLLKETNKLVSNLNDTIKALNNTIDSLKKVNEDQAKEILRLKDKNNKDSSNSSKPSSTNNFKKVVTNRREKSNKTKGGQKGHKAHSLNNKLNQFINSGNVLEEVIEINKNVNNQNKKYIEKVVIDIKITKHIKRYRYYPYQDGKYYIPKNHNQYVQYGNNVKAISIDLMNNLYNSTDGIVRFISDITNNGITLSNGTLINWNNELSTKLSPELENIESNLLDSYFINHDESQIKIDGDGYNVLCACNKKHVRLWQHKHKSQDALDEIGFLPKYHGVIVKDGTELYNKYGCFLSQCLSHIQRYLKGIYDFIHINHQKNYQIFLQSIII
ncbi:MAG: transposase [Bacilli bacterium]